MTPLKIYVAGPLTDAGTATEEKQHEYARNAIEAGIQLMQKGHFPYVPHLSLAFDKQARNQGIEFSWQQWMAKENAYLECCDAVLYIGSSIGADIELKKAEQRGIPVYTSVEQIGRCNHA